MALTRLTIPGLFTRDRVGEGGEGGQCVIVCVIVCVCDSVCSVSVPLEPRTNARLPMGPGSFGLLFGIIGEPAPYIVKVLVLRVGNS